MQRDRDCQPHVSKVNWGEVRGRLLKVNPALAQALDAINRSSPVPLYIVRYQFGQPILNIAEDRKKKFHPPCSSSSCEACVSLMQVCKNILPLGVLLNRSAEIYSEDKQDTGGQRPAVSVQMLHAGDAFGVIGLLDKLAGVTVKMDGFRWKIDAGARTVKCSFPVGDKQLVRKILSQSLGRVPAKEEIINAQKAFEWDNRELIFALLQAVELEAKRKDNVPQPNTDWKLEVLIIPAEWVTGLVRQKKLSGTHLFFDTLKNMGLQKLANFKNYLGINAQITSVIERIPTVPQSAFLQRTVAHNIAIFNGIKPGYRPVGKDDSAGPFNQLLKFIWRVGLARSPGLKGRFPLLLQPEQVSGRYKGTLYYSLQQPSVPGPFTKNGTMKESLVDLQVCLREIRKQVPGLFPPDSMITYLHSSPDGRDEVDSGGNEITHPRNCKELLDDFADQWELAQTIWKMNSKDSFFHNVKQEFMAAFIRFELPKVEHSQVEELMRSEIAS